MTRRRGAPARTSDRTCWSLSQRIPSVMGDIMLELLRKAHGESGPFTETASHDGIVLEQVFTKPPVVPRAWRLKALPVADLVANNRLSAPLRIGRRWLVVPSNFEATKTRQVQLKMDAGMGFGSGRHETTRLCLEILETIPPPASLLDLGTGSGILAIAASKLGTGFITAVENDPAALRSARGNGRLNGCVKTIHWIRADICVWKSKRRFSLVTANLLGHLLMKQASRIASWTAPRGRVIASGFFHKERKEVEAAFARAGLRRVHHARQGRWGVMLLRTST